MTVTRNMSVTTALGALVSFMVGPPAAAFGDIETRTARIEGLRVSVAADVETVFSWGADRCDEEDIPDIGLRLFRRFDERIIAFSSHQRTRRFLVGEDGGFERDCSVVHDSVYSSNPADFADATWIAATWTEDGRIIHALGHNEYRADRHWFACDYDAYLACWYNTIVGLRSDDGGESFSRIGDAAPIAGATFRHDAHQGQPRGFFEPTNIVEHQGRLHTLVYTAGGPGQPPGTCLFATADISDPSDWRYWTGDAFARSSFDPYRSEPDPDRPACAPLENLDGRVSSLVRHEPSGLFLATVAAQGPRMEKGWIGISASRDLKTWTRPAMLLRLPLIWSTSCSDEIRYAYPALADLGSASRNFDAAGDSPALYMTRMKIAGCAPTMDRDLVRIPLRLGADP